MKLYMTGNPKDYPALAALIVNNEKHMRRLE